MSPHFGMVGIASATIDVASEREGADECAGAEERERQHARRRSRGQVSDAYGWAAFGAGRRWVSR